MQVYRHKCIANFSHVNDFSETPLKLLHEATL